MEKREIMNKFRRCILEYTNANDAFGIEEDGEDTMDPSMGGGAPMDNPSMGGGAPADGSGAPMGDPSMGGEAPMDDPSMGDQSMGDPSMDGGATADSGTQAAPPEGFSPQGVDLNASLDGMGGAPNEGGSMGGAPTDNSNVGPNDDVIDVDDLTDSQEETEKKVDALSAKFERLLGSLDGIEKRINDIDSHTNEYLGTLKGEFEKRNPTPMQRMTMRSTKSAPYAMTPNEYMNNYAPDNYSDESDNNGADDPQYQITKGDIDGFTDYSSIAKEIEDNKMGLREILGL